MRRLTLTATLTTVAALALPAAASAHVTRLRLTEIVTSQQLIPSPAHPASAQGPAAGDTLIQTSKLLQHGKTIGHVRIFNVFTDPPFGEFLATATVPGGHLSLLDTIKLNQPQQTFAIVGGTGTYRNARGTVHIKAITDRKSIDTITIIT